MTMMMSKDRRRAGSAAAIAAAGLAAIALALGAAGCAIFGGGSKGGDEFKLTLTSTSKLNACGNDAGNALAVRVYQLSGDAKISISSLGSLWGDEDDELKGELLKSDEFLLEPGSKDEVKVLRLPDAQVIAVVGNFCKGDGDCWRWYQPLSKIGDSAKLTFDESCIVEARQGKKK